MTGGLRASSHFGKYKAGECNHAISIKSAVFNFGGSGKNSTPGGGNCSAEIERLHFDLVIVEFAIRGSHYATAYRATIAVRVI